MLIEFSVENYRSFAEEQTLSLVAGKDSNHPEHVVDCGKFGLLKAAALYGSNASGKSNLLKAFRFMDDFVRKSATTMTLGDPIAGIEPFRLDPQWRDKPTAFEVRLLLDGTEYQYGFSATIERVHDEWLYVRRKGGRLSNPLLREYAPDTDETSWTLRGELKQAKDLTDKTRDNGLFLSRAAEMNVAFVKELFLWFRTGLRYFDLASPPDHLLQETARRVCGDDGFRARVESLVHDADLGIDEIAAREEELRWLDDFPKYVHALASHIEKNIDDAADDEEGLIVQSPDFRERFRDFRARPRGVREPPREFRVQTRHRFQDSGEHVDFSLENDESNGTQRFFALVGPILNTLDKGSLLVVDELECSMHPLLTFKLVELFQSPDTNPNGAQIVFATHDSTLMTPALFRRDQIWLTEKRRSGATSLFSLSDIEKRPRQREAFEANYLAGRYGGVPNFGPAFEDLEIK